MSTRSSYAIEQRLRLVDFLLAQYGTVNRSALERYFGISSVQASIDFRDYAALAPDNMRYDASARTYRATPTFKQVFP